MEGISIYNYNRQNHNERVYFESDYFIRFGIPCNLVIKAFRTSLDTLKPNRVHP